MQIININELQENLSEQEFDKLMKEYNKKEEQANFIELFCKIDEESKLITEKFDIDGETYKFIRSMKLEEGETIGKAFFDILEDYVYSNWNIKHALLNPTGAKNYFEIAVENL